MRRRTAGLISALAIGSDLAVKSWVESSLPFEQPVPVIPFLSWYRTWNEGIAFSFLSFLNDWVLVGITVLIIIFVLWLWQHTLRERWLSQLGFALVFGGAIGNLFDRVFLGHVVDFIMVHTDTWSFAIFNLADSFISVGAAAIILDEILSGFRELNKPKSGA
ncbi:MAG: signal peptidase II [Salaquimonas sp.]